MAAALFEPLVRQALYVKRKNGLFRRAMELGILCDCEVAVIVMNKEGRLASFSSQGMENILRRYAAAAQQPHEVHTEEELYNRYVVEPRRHAKRVLSQIGNKADSEPTAKKPKKCEPEETVRDEERVCASPIEAVEVPEPAAKTHENGVGQKEAAEDGGDDVDAAAEPQKQAVSGHISEAFSHLNREFDKLSSQLTTHDALVASMAARHGAARSLEGTPHPEDEHELLGNGIALKGTSLLGPADVGSATVAKGGLQASVRDEEVPPIPDMLAVPPTLHHNTSKPRHPSRFFPGVGGNTVAKSGTSEGTAGGP